MSLTIEKGSFEVAGSFKSPVKLVDAQNQNRADTNMTPIDLAKMGKERLEMFYERLKRTLDIMKEARARRS